MNDQRSVTEQLWDAVHLCNQAGMYDAADWIRDRLTERHPKRPVQIVVTNPEDIERLLQLRRDLDADLAKRRAAQ